MKKIQFDLKKNSWCYEDKMGNEVIFRRLPLKQKNLYTGYYHCVICKNSFLVLGDRFNQVKNFIIEKVYYCNHK